MWRARVAVAAAAWPTAAALRRGGGIYHLSAGLARLHSSPSHPGASFAAPASARPCQHCAQQARFMHVATALRSDAEERADAHSADTQQHDDAQDAQDASSTSLPSVGTAADEQDSPVAFPSQAKLEALDALAADAPTESDADADASAVDVDETIDDMSAGEIDTDADDASTPSSVAAEDAHLPAELQLSLRLERAQPPSNPLVEVVEDLAAEEDDEIEVEEGSEEDIEADLEAESDSEDAAVNVGPDTSVEVAPLQPSERTNDSMVPSAPAAAAVDVVVTAAAPDSIPLPSSALLRSRQYSEFSAQFQSAWDCMSIRQRKRVPHSMLSNFFRVAGKLLQFEAILRVWKFVHPGTDRRMILSTPHALDLLMQACMRHPTQAPGLSRLCELLVELDAVTVAAVAKGKEPPAYSREPAAPAKHVLGATKPAAPAPAAKSKAPRMLLTEKVANQFIKSALVANEPALALDFWHVLIAGSSPASSKSLREMYKTHGAVYAPLKYRLHSQAAYGLIMYLLQRRKHSVIQGEPAATLMPSADVPASVATSIPASVMAARKHQDLLHAFQIYLQTAFVEQLHDVTLLFRIWNTVLCSVLSPPAAPLVANSKKQEEIQLLRAHNAWLAFQIYRFVLGHNEGLDAAQEEQQQKQQQQQQQQTSKHGQPAASSSSPAASAVRATPWSHMLHRRYIQMDWAAHYRPMLQIACMRATGELAAVNPGRKAPSGADLTSLQWIDVLLYDIRVTFADYQHLRASRTLDAAEREEIDALEVTEAHQAETLASYATSLARHACPISLSSHTAVPDLPLRPMDESMFQQLARVYSHCGDATCLLLLYQSIPPLRRFDSLRAQMLSELKTYKLPLELDNLPHRQQRWSARTGAATESKHEALVRDESGLPAAMQLRALTTRELFDTRLKEPHARSSALHASACPAHATSAFTYILAACAHRGDVAAALAHFDVERWGHIQLNSSHFDTIFALMRDHAKDKPLGVKVVIALHRALMHHPASVRPLPTVLLLFDAYVALTGLPAGVAQGQTRVLPASLTKAAVEEAAHSLNLVHNHLIRVFLGPVLQMDITSDLFVASLPPLLSYLQSYICWRSQHGKFRKKAPTGGQTPEEVYIQLTCALKRAEPVRVQPHADASYADQPAEMALGDVPEDALMCMIAGKWTVLPEARRAEWKRLLETIPASHEPLVDSTTKEASQAPSSVASSAREQFARRRSATAAAAEGNKKPKTAASKSKSTAAPAASTEPEPSSPQSSSHQVADILQSLEEFKTPAKSETLAKSTSEPATPAPEPATPKQSAESKRALLSAKLSEAVRDSHAPISAAMERQDYAHVIRLHSRLLTKLGKLAPKIKTASERDALLDDEARAQLQAMQLMQQKSVALSIKTRASSSDGKFKTETKPDTKNIAPAIVSGEKKSSTTSTTAKANKVSVVSSKVAPKAEVSSYSVFRSLGAATAVSSPVITVTAHDISAARDLTDQFARPAKLAEISKSGRITKYHTRMLAAYDSNQLVAVSRDYIRMRHTYKDQDEDKGMLPVQLQEFQQCMAMGKEVMHMWTPEQNSYLERMVRGQLSPNESPPVVTAVQAAQIAAKRAQQFAAAAESTAVSAAPAVASSPSAASSSSSSLKPFSKSSRPKSPVDATAAIVFAASASSSPKSVSTRVGSKSSKFKSRSASPVSEAPPAAAAASPNLHDADAVSLSKVPSFDAARSVQPQNSVQPVESVQQPSSTPSSTVKASTKDASPATSLKKKTLVKNAVSVASSQPVVSEPVATSSQPAPAFASVDATDTAHKSMLAHRRLGQHQQLVNVYEQFRTQSPDAAANSRDDKAQSMRRMYDWALGAINKEPAPQAAAQSHTDSTATNHAPRVRTAKIRAHEQTTKKHRKVTVRARAASTPPHHADLK